MSIFLGILFDFRKVIIEAFLLFGLWFLLRQETNKLKKIVEDLGDKIGDLQEDVSSVQENAADETHEQSWGIAKDNWSSTRARIQQEIRNIRNKRSRGKYRRFKKYTYEGIINQLRIDRVISSDVQIKLLEMDKLFRIFRRQPKNIKDADLKRFQDLYSHLKTNNWS